MEMVEGRDTRHEREEDDDVEFLRDDGKVMRLEEHEAAISTSSNSREAPGMEDEI